jgi:hypothetical protein
MINLALKEDGAEVPVPDPDSAARDAKYNEQDLQDVLDAIDAQARRFADRMRSLDDDALAHTVVQSGHERTVAEMVRNVAHEGAFISTTSANSSNEASR